MIGGIGFRIILLCGAILITCSRAFCFPVTMLDDRKHEVTVEARPQRIISLAPTNTELLFALGLGNKVVGVTRYCDYPAEAKQREKVGGFVDFDLDRIADLKPDLVLAFGTIQLPVVADIEKRGIKVFWIYPRTTDDVLASFERVGIITGAEKEARLLQESVGKEISALRTAFADLPDSKRPSVFRVMSFNSAATIGAASFQSDLFWVAGGRNAFPVPGKDYIELTKEELSKGDPAVVLVCGNDAAGLSSRTKENELYRNLSAVKKDSILVLPCELTCRPGPRIGEMARRLAAYLHPELEGIESKSPKARTGK